MFTAASSSPVRRLAVLTAVVVVLAGTLGYARGTAGTAAQDAMSSHPVVGVWRFTNEVGDATFPSLGVFHADGTYVEDYPDESSFSLGLWRPTGERGAEVTVYQNYVVDDKLANGEGRWTVAVDETGNALTQGDGFFLGLFEDGSVEFSIEWEGSTDPVATRLEIQPVVPLASLLPEGTPAP
jgi:hypothetical protein